ncbi:hypothetical protein [Microtetraspora malaysiensis]|uniref:Uncharacterized protein n=1 Tax=Microtetraspora malaysiensis TaxID=161358 RepID=A0ABW6T4B9_9ACTN
MPQGSRRGESRGIAHHVVRHPPFGGWPCDLPADTLRATAGRTAAVGQAAS